MQYIQKMIHRFYRSVYKPIALRLRLAQVKTKLWLTGVSVGKGLVVEGDVCLGCGANIVLGHHIHLGKDIYICAWPEGELIIGNNTYIGRMSIILAHQSVVIGDDCLIAPGCHITDVNHGITPGVLIRKQPLVSKSIRIGNDVWIGAGCSILPGVTIGNGAVVGARSVVTGDVPEGAIVVGVPARILRYRDKSNK